MWYHHRVGRITASKFGAVNTRRRTTPPDNLVRSIMQYGRTDKCQRTVPALVHGQLTEHKAREAQIRHKEQSGCPVTVTTSGLFIDGNNPWCGASPDGLVDDQRASDPCGLSEFKCPYVEQFCTVEELIATRKQFYLKKEGNSIVMNKKHQYYVQVQGQMGIGGRKWSDFVVYVECNNQTDIVIVRVMFDKDFWESVRSKLIYFYWRFVVIPWNANLSRNVYEQESFLSTELDNHKFTV